MSQKHLQSGDSLPPLTEGAMHLFSMRYCPYAQRSRLVLSIKGLSFEEVNCNLSQKPEFLLERNPNGKVPVLEINGKVFIESSIINDLLDDLYPDPPLYPKDPYAKAEDKIFMEEYSSKVIPHFYKFAKSDCQDKEAEEKLMAGLEIFEAELKKRGTPFLGGQQPAMVDLNIWPFNERFVIADALTNLIKQKFPELDSYCRRMEAHPAIKPIVTSKEILREFAKGYQVGTFKYDDL
ncbi:pyrimidodiazepine synthase-like [Asterias rubens]|uniref:pyrimidodiazepine synthase-like n=1 Tax=Asterias rubens TaxID=7604 RepID=UPI001455D6CD|nr:pyrimidodiazepine synthase-like [Asterias rubens]